MWEAIAANRRKSMVLISLMGVILVVLGFFIGSAMAPQGGVLGVFIAFIVWLILWGISVVAGDSLLLASTGAHEISKKDAPQLWNVLEEMAIAAGFTTLPKLYIIENDAPNAFAVGRDPKMASVAVTSGLLKRLDRDELQGVVAHEVSHILNRDVKFMTLASVMLGAIVLMSDLFFRTMRFGGRRRMSRGKGGGQAEAIILVVAILLAILAPLVARILFFACSRKREFLADASAARLTRYPEGLASALQKIAMKNTGQLDVNRAVAPLFIVNPLQGMAVSSIFSTHPATEERIKILRSMAGMAGYHAYEAAFQKVRGKGSRLLGAETLQAAKEIPARKAPAEGEAKGKERAIQRARDVSNLLSALGNYLVIPCACGVSIKVPPEFQEPTVPCARCGKVHEVARNRGARGAQVPVESEAKAGDQGQALSPSQESPSGVVSGPQAGNGEAGGGPPRNR